MKTSESVFQSLVQKIMEAARSSDNLCIIGEIGTGKRQAAMSVHRATGLDEARFATVNCMALSHDDFLSDLFGRVTSEGDVVRKGAIALAEGGTLYLHEVHELARESQAALVRFLEAKAYRPVGSGMNLTSNVRVIASSSAALEALVEVGKFRQDLQHFLTPLIIHMPRLNERLEDIPALFKSLVFQITNGTQVSVSDDALARLKTHNYTGNLLELRNLALRSVSSMTDNHISLEDVEGAIRGTAYFDLADQKLASRYNELAEQAGDTFTKSIAAIARPTQITHVDDASSDEKQEDAGSMDFSSLNNHVSMDAFERNESPSSPQISPAVQTTSTASVGSKSDGVDRQPARGTPDLKGLERQYFLDLIEQYEGDKSKVAKTAGLTLRTLYRRLKALDIE